MAESQPPVTPISGDLRPQASKSTGIHKHTPTVSDTHLCINKDKISNKQNAYFLENHLICCLTFLLYNHVYSLKRAFCKMNKKTRSLTQVTVIKDYILRYGN